MTDGLVDRAAALAREVHRAQERKGTGMSYFDGHLEPVARLVAESGGSDVQIAAAYLHDAVEDGGGPVMAEQIERMFGSAVADIVLHLSDSVIDTTDGAEKEDWTIRKRRYIADLASAPRVALEVSVADKLHNARALLDDYERLGPEIWDIFSEQRPERQLWYYTSLLDIFEDDLAGHPLTAQLAGTLTVLRDRVRADDPGIDERLAATRAELA